MTVTLRGPRRADLAALAAMITELAAHHGDTARIDVGALARDTIGPRRWFRVTLAVAGGDIRGYVAALPLGLLQWGARGIDLQHLAVQPDARGQGIGGALVSAVLAEARRDGCDYVTVGTGAGNTAVAGFYRRFGFADHPVTGTRLRLRLRSG